MPVNAVFAGATVFFGVLVSLPMIICPQRVIQWQTRYYRSMNWIMEPIDLPREIRTTRLLGVGMLSISIAMLVYSFM